MSLVTSIPTSLVFPTANVNTEAARRENLTRETIPQSSDSQQSASDKGLGSESDKARNPGQNPAPVTYERPQSHSDLAGSEGAQTDARQKDNGQEQSSGREGAEQEQRQRQEQQEIERLKARDAEVRKHEQAHATMGGQYAGAPSYEYEVGPDSKRYAVGGEVNIDVSEAATPEQTVRKMQQVRAAALAPAEPSVQDLKVANEATQKTNQARAEMARSDKAQADDVETGDYATPRVPTLDEMVQQGGVSAPYRKLSGALDPAQRDTPEGAEQRTLHNEVQARAERIGLIQQRYQSVYQSRDAGFSASA